MARARPTARQAPRPRPGCSRWGIRYEQLPRWGAALATALVHVLLVLLLMWAAPITLSNPEGSAGGGRIEVTYIDVPADIPSPPEFPVARPQPRREPAPPRPDAVTPPAAPPVQTTLVVQPEDPLPPDTSPPRELASPPPPPSQARATRPRQYIRGQPPGTLPEDHARLNAGTAPTAAVDRGRRHRVSAGEPNLEAGGYQVIYDLMAETRLRAWRDEGMTELSLPLPGVRQLMVCPLETALRRGSGPCRLVEPDDPGLADIGDARQVVALHQVYRRGELVWWGPGPYR